MDQNEFSRRLRLLAGDTSHHVDQSVDPYTRILGSLGFAYAVRRSQAAALSMILGFCAVIGFSATDLGSGGAGLCMAVIFAAAGVLFVRHVPYWTPTGALRDGLLTLSGYQLNDLGSFLLHQRTDLTIVNNTLLSDLCIQLVMDKRRCDDQIGCEGH